MLESLEPSPMVELSCCSKCMELVVPASDLVEETDRQLKNALSSATQAYMSPNQSEGRMTIGVSHVSLSCSLGSVG